MMKIINKIVQKIKEMYHYFNYQKKIDDGNEFCHTRKEMQLKDMLI